ncbi:MAG: hypothetical protein H6627_07455 [Calditrichae bacterium]|nr:hypothetical protein [Calditrichia bacterium]
MQNYSSKLTKFIPQTFFELLPEPEKKFIRDFAGQGQLTFQEFRQITEIARDMQMWGEESLSSWMPDLIKTALNRATKKEILQKVIQHHRDLQKAAKVYNGSELERPKKREKGRIALEQGDKNIFGMCPVASEKTVCCNLKTIDAVENCVFGCSYCTIQTFYHDKTVFDENLAAKLEKIALDPDRQYHIGTGQSSDSLVWGNKNGNLDALCTFARKNPNVLLEFKTKSDNIKYFLENDIPANIVCSWSLNPQVIIDNEEHFTASLEERLQAARAVADKGVKVSFHFHPIVWFDKWQEEYSRIVYRLLNMFIPSEILFISFGSVTFIKPVLKKIRKQGFPTRITQMEMVTDPHGKMTYPDEIKIKKFSTMYETFKSWHGKVFFYLCMEKADIWEKSLGFVYPDNDTFEKDFLKNSMAKIKRSEFLQNN